MKFSQRHGINTIEKPLQIESIDEELRIGLWNIYKIYILDVINRHLGQNSTRKREFFIRIYLNHFKIDIDNVPYDFSSAYNIIKEVFLHEAQWYEVFELIEASICSIKMDRNYYFVDISEFQDLVNHTLEKEFSAYRLINEIFVPISNESEVKEIEQAIQNTKPFTTLLGSNIHLTEALKILSDRKTIDYRNSIKESISAIETLAKVISEKKSDSLGKTLSIVKAKIGLHTSLEEGFKKIYGYTSDADGIRHSLMDEPNCDFDDAKYMLVSSSAFINYLIAKAIKAGVTFT